MALAFALATLSVLLLDRIAWATPAETAESVSVPCAVLEDFSGDVEVLDSSRTHLVSLSRRTGVPCGGWVGVGKGYAKLKHRDGHRAHVGAGSFVQVPQDNADGKRSGEQLVLFRGQVYAQASGGNDELRIITANARARVTRGTIIVVYNQEDDETQLVALEGKSLIENRFETSRRVTVKPGEASALNFKLLRVVPSIPRAVAYASLKPKFDDLRVPERERSHAVRTARERQDRVFASALVKDKDVDEEDDGEDQSEAPAKVAAASQAEKKAVKAAKAKELEAIKKAAPITEYARHPTDGNEGDLREHWVNRMVAGEKVGEKILFPDKFYGRPRKVKVEVEDIDAKFSQRKQEADVEKARLIEELSQIREE